MKFLEKLLLASRKNKSLVCCGLDPDRAKIPQGVSVLEFNRAVIKATADLVCAYKLNFAFYEALGADGFNILKESIASVPDYIPVIGDAKRGDIGNTAKAYAAAIFDELDCDAATVSPYLGFDSIEPFINYQDRGVFILCRTSNASAVDFQSLNCRVDGGVRQLFEIVAEKAQRWDTNKNIGLVVGATYPSELRQIRQAHPDLPILIPGIGAQGGDLELAVRYGVDGHGERAIINSSRQILYASSGRDFAEAARREASDLRGRINSFRI